MIVPGHYYWLPKHLLLYYVDAPLHYTWRQWADDSRVERYGVDLIDPSGHFTPSSPMGVDGRRVSPVFVVLKLGALPPPND